MKDYLESEVSGKQWRRCHTIVISNPTAPQKPYVTFQEQDMIEVGDKIMQVGTDACSEGFDPAAVVELLDPSSLQPIGQTITEGEIYVMLFSKYIAAAKKRDTQREEMAAASAAMQAAMVNVQPAGPL